MRFWIHLRRGQCGSRTLAGRVVIETADGNCLFCSEYQCWLVLEKQSPISGREHLEKACKVAKRLELSVNEDDEEE